MNLSKELLWVDQANCKGVETDEFFVPDGRKTYENQPILKRICGACTVKDDCLNYALHNNVTGYWGGTSEKTRAATRKRLGIIAKGLAFEGLYD